MWKCRCILVLVLVGISVSALAAESVEVTFWPRPNPLWVEYWQYMADRYMVTNPVINGKPVVVKIASMPTKPSSEAAIQMAIAGGTVATGSGNIVTGFGLMLAKDGHLVPLDELPGFWELMEQRAIADTIREKWVAPDGHVYTVPNFSNPKIYAWRIDILRELGYQHPPRSYSEVFELGRVLKARYPDKFLMVDDRTVDPTWWKRWGDFFPFYHAFIAAPFVTNNKLTVSDAMVVEVFEFFHGLFDNDLLLTAKAQDPFPTGLCVWTRINAWDPIKWRDKYPELVFGENYVLSPPVVPDWYPQDLPIHFFTDEKGIVIYANASEEERLAIWDFYRFVLGDPQNDLTYFETTGVLPSRGDITTNPILASAITPETFLWSYAVSVAIPSMAHPKFAEIQEALGAQGFIPALRGEKPSGRAWADAKAAIEDLLTD